ncbi:hypothetical protein V1511DRAFT_269426 [Dipodascopsis uninucleata]
MVFQLCCRRAGLLNSNIYRQRVIGVRFKSSAKIFDDVKANVYDVIIVGGGVSGLTLAAGMKSSPVTSDLRIALVEGFSLEPARKWTPSLDIDDLSNRCSSITPASKQFLEKIGAWNHVYQERVQPYDDMRVWDGITGASIRFDAFQSNIGHDIAYMTENINLQHALLERLDELGSIDIFDGTKVLDIKNGEKYDDVDLSSWPALHLSSEDTLFARLLVGADGGLSPVRRYAGIKSRGWDYNQHGVVATLKMEWADEQNIAWQRFLPTGPIALLPMPNGYASLVWSTTPQMAAHLKSLSPAAFCASVNSAFRFSQPDLNYILSRTDEVEINEEFEWRDSRLELSDEGVKYPIRVVELLEGSRASFPLKMRHCDTYVAPRVALVGDAAHTTHPLAGQGLNLGQGDVKALVKVLEDSIQLGADIGSEICLEKYLADRWPANHVMLGIVDKLQKLYTTDFTPVVAARTLGLEIVQSLPWLKSMIMVKAAGV